MEEIILKVAWQLLFIYPPDVQMRKAIWWPLFVICALSYTGPLALPVWVVHVGKQLCLHNKFPQSFVLLSHLKFLMWTFL